MDHDHKVDVLQRNTRPHMHVEEPRRGFEPAADLAEVQRLGLIDSRERQPSQTSSVMVWQSMNMSPTFRQVAALPGRTLLDNARFYALMSMAADDAYLAVTDAKLHYSFWRPVAAIRNAHLDGNEATIHDPDW